MKRFLRSRGPIAVFILLFGLSGFAQKPQTPNPLVPQPKREVEAAPKATPAAPAPLTEADVSAFLDGVVPLQIERNDIAGAVVTIVKDGEVLFSRGYGYADVEKKKPVSDTDTLFRPGSISKLFTWTAVMQLVEQGKLDLDRDVNAYLDFKIPATYPQPITLRNIMTHTPGFEETVKELFVAKPKDMAPLRQYLAEHMPQRIFPPGTTPAYSNYATGLAGYIVQRVSGEKFEDYIAAHIFQPLGMTHATFVQPLPENLKALMSQGYQVGSGKPKEFELIPASPAGALAVAGQDIARFMMAHLQDGEFNGQRILKPETARLMHSRQFGLAPELNGMCLGFYEESRNGHRIIGHGGDTMWFHSDLHLVLDQNFGFFISQNSAGKGDVGLRTAVWKKFRDRYFPYEPPQATPPASKMADAKMVSGSYLASRRSETNLLRIGAYISELEVSSHPDGTIQTDAAKDFNGQPKKFEEIAPLVYRDVNGQAKLVFLKNPSGGFTLAGDFPAVEYQTVPWYQNENFVFYLLVGCVVVLALTLIFWIIAALVRRHYGRKLELAPAQRGLRLMTRIVCIIQLGAFAAWTGVFLRLLGDITRSAGMDPWFHLAQALTIVGVLVTILAIVNMIAAWLSERWWWSKIWETLIALACVGFVWLAIFGHLWGWSVKY
jgi:CubicO group peptidase (beta-lactamase class C family)